MQAQDPDEGCDDPCRDPPRQGRRYASPVNVVTIGLGLLGWAAIAGLVILVVWLI